MDTDTDNVHLSKYARKQQERAEGTRPPFEFVERATSARATHTKKSGEPPDHRKTKSVQSKKQVIATVSAWGQGHLFLQQQNGPDLFMGMYILKKSKLTGVRVGTVLLCEVEPHPNGKGPRVRKILSRIEN